MRYDHTNYARWGTKYLNEIHQLPAEVEWLNGIGKKGGGIIGITKISTALSRWALSYNMQSHIAFET